MNTARFLFILFALLNIVIFAVARGWTGGGQTDDSLATMTKRVSIYPERIRIVKPEPAQTASQTPERRTTASPPVSAPPPPPSAQPVCMMWNGLGTAQTNKLISLLSSAGIQVATKESQTPSAWQVRIPPLASREAAEILVDNMTRLGIDKNTSRIEDSGNNKFVILINEPFKNQVEAYRYLETVKARGVHNAEIETRSVVDRQVKATASINRIDATLAGQPFAKRYKPCTP
ncbi:MAG: hypothetical protein LBG78_01915 [Azoarcus sp.]|jgi:hypothetical protein|nr:hypothetical protein [Azoarcus sp.]